MAVAAPIPVERNWVDALSASGSERDEAVADLHDLLLRAARFEIGPRQAALSHVRGEELLTDVLDLDAVTRVREYGTAGVSRFWDQATRTGMRARQPREGDGAHE